MIDLLKFVVLAHPDHEAAAWDPVSLAIFGVGALVALIVIVIIGRALFGGKRKAAGDEGSLTVDVGKLSTAGPPTSGPQLEIYNVPVRLVLLVLAPAGRGGSIPPNEQLPTVVDAIAPNLMQVVTAHQPEFRRWPPQLSSQGFSQVFFTNVPLPGDAGKGTPWCATAGKFETPVGPFLVGLVGVAETPNSLGQVAVAQTGQWLDILRVKSA